jgi:hypothetical protein
VRAQNNESYKTVDSFMQKFSFSPSTIGDIKTLTREIKLQVNNPEELVRAAFMWITNNIVYDCDGYRHNNGLYKLEDVIPGRRAICSGYASLLKLFCDGFGIECVIIEGFATGIGVTESSLDSLKTNHAWNAVKINDEWKLIDATWGSGGSNSDCTKSYHHRNDNYFFCDPEKLIITHFPDSSRWQLLNTPVTASQFVNSVRSWKSSKDVDAQKPKDSVIIKKVGDTVRFLFTERDSFNMVTISLYTKNDQSLADIFDSVRRNENGYYYDYKVKRAGYYRVDVSLYYDRGDNKEMTGTSIETYYLQVPSRKNKVATLPKLQKASTRDKTKGG